MRKHHIIVIVFLLFLTAYCPSAFAQYTIDELINNDDISDGSIIGTMYPESSYSNQRNNSKTENSPSTATNKAYLSLSRDEQNLYYDFQDAYQTHHNATALSVFNGSHPRQVVRVVKAIIEDNPETLAFFENEGWIHSNDYFGNRRLPKHAFDRYPSARGSNRPEISTGQAYYNLSDDDQNLYLSFRTAYLSRSSSHAVMVFNGKTRSQVNRVAKAIVEDSPELREMFDNYGLLSHEKTVRVESVNRPETVDSSQSVNQNQALVSNSKSNIYQHAQDPYSSYNLLNENEKNLYNLMYPIISKAQPSLSLNGKPDSETITTALDAIIQDHPEFVWAVSGYRSSTTYSNKTTTIIYFTYNSLAENAMQYQKEFENAAAAILDRARQERTLLDMEKYVFDYLVMHVKYQSHDLDQVGYASLVMGQSVCNGIAMTFQYLMHQLGIPVYFRIGSDHAWNVVMINGQWYNVDATTSRAGIQSEKQLKSQEERYFNKPIHQQFWRTPAWDEFPTNRLTF